MKEIILSISALFLFFSPVAFAQNNVSEDVDKIQLFLKALDERYVDSVETDDLVEKAMKRMLEELDPHSVYLTPEGYRKANEPLKGSFVGIGIRYRMVDDTLTIVEVFDDSPAQRASLMVGDQLVRIEGDTVAGVEMHESKITDRIKGEANTDLRLAVFRPVENQHLVITMQRGQVRMKSIEVAHMMTDEVGYIKLDRFSSTSYNEFKKALAHLSSEGMDDLVLDLRGNSGGYLNIAIKIADEFLDNRKVIVYTEGLHQSKKELFATSGGRFLNGKLIVLMDENSASASEILAGAIQDWDRGLIIGRRSYGKGLVQRTVEFKDGSAMRLTVSRYYTPTGRSIQKPYEDGVDAYRDDLQDRLEHGELYSKDSMLVDDERVFYTPAHRAVYGGGGIIPDIFIPLDTNGGSDYFNGVASKGLIEGFAIRYVEAHHSKLHKEYTSQKKFADRFEVEDEMMDAFTAYAEQRGEPLDQEQFDISKTRLEQYLKSYIARFTFDMDAFYLSYGNYDPYIRTALSEFENNTFEELGLK